MTTQQIDNKVRESVWEIAQSMRIINKQGPGHEQWDLVIDGCITQSSNLTSKMPLSRLYIADMTNLHGLRH